MVFLKKYLPSYLSLIFIAVVVVVFFSPHLFPAKVYLAGDFGGSDFTDLFWPLKSFLARSLRQGELPLWNEQVGAGFPILGEGEIQLFSPTTLFFWQLSLPLAFQLTIILAFLINGFGVFFLGRELGYSKPSSIFAALALTLAAPFILGLGHLTIVTAAALIPWSWLVIFKWAAKYQKQPSIFPETLYLAAILGYQFLQASPQISLLTFFTSGFLFLVLLWPKNQARFGLLDSRQLGKLGRPLLFLGLAFGLSLALGSIQILPSWEMWRHSNRSGQFQPEEMLRFSLTAKRLVNFAVPFALSNPSQPPAYFRFEEGPLLWETNGYAGLLTLFFGAAGIFLSRRKQERALAWLLLLSLILAFGPQTPFGQILRVFPFSAFRVPGRFLIPVDLCLALLAASFLDQRIKPAFQKIASRQVSSLLVIGLITFLIADLFHYGLSYNASVDASEFFQDPRTAQLIKREDDRYLTLAGWYVYNVIYLKEQGWRGKGDAYLPFQETLFPNINLLYQTRGVSSYAGMKIKRSNELDSILQSYFTVDPPKNRAQVSFSALNKMMNLTATRFLISPFEINLPFPPLAELAVPNPHSSLRVYRLPEPKPRAWFSSQAKYVTSENYLQQLLVAGSESAQATDFSPTLLETPLDQVFPNCPNLGKPAWGDQTWLPAKITQTTNQEVVLTVQAPRCGLVVLADTFYPGWQATVDDQPVKIFRANYNFRAVPVSAGSHLVKFSYRPETFRLGIWLSFFSWTLTGSLLLGKRLHGHFRK